MGHSEAAARDKPTHPTRLWCSLQSSLAPPRRDLEGKITCLDVPLAYVYRSALSREHWRLALSKLENSLKSTSTWNKLGLLTSFLLIK